MIHSDNPLKPHAEAHLRSTIGAVSGLAILDLAATLVKAGANTGMIAVTIQISGWSPSLNRFGMQWEAMVQHALDAEMQGRILVDELADRIDVQRDRLAQGLTLGVAAPFGVSDMDGTIDDTKWSHILVDQGLAELLQEGQNDGFHREVSDSVFDLHQDDQGMRTGLETEIHGDLTDEDHEPIDDMTHGLVGRLLHHDVEVADGVHYDGLRLSVDRSLPDTVLAIAAGRRLGDIVEVPRAIADHVIVEATRRSGRIELHVAPVTRLAGEIHAEIVAAHDAGMPWPEGRKG